MLVALRFAALEVTRDMVEGKIVRLEDFVDSSYIEVAGDMVERHMVVQHTVVVEHMDLADEAVDLEAVVFVFARQPMHQKPLS